MCRTVETTAAANCDNVPALRRWVTHHVADTYGDAGLRADAAVFAADLISNAVRAES